MIFDILAGLAVLLAFVEGRNGGAMAAVYRTGATLGAAVLAKLLCSPTANAIIKGVEWSPQFAQGLVFLTYFLLFLMVGRFSLGGLIRHAEMNRGDGGLLDRGLGGLIGAARGATIAYALIASTVLLVHRWGAKAPSMALPFSKSWSGRTVVGWNVADPEVFPNAYVLRAALGLEENAGPRPEVLDALRQWDGIKVLTADADIARGLAESDWKALRKNRALLELIEHPEFLALADAYYTPRNAVKAENPEDRFQELKAK